MSRALPYKFMNYIKIIIFWETESSFRREKRDLLHARRARAVPLEDGLVGVENEDIASIETLDGYIDLLHTDVATTLRMDK